MLHFCTYFDINYLARGLTLFQSLQEHSTVPFKFYVLCLDEKVKAHLESLENSQIICIALEDLEKHDQELLNSKRNRSLIEYYFTLSPCLPLYVLNKYEIEHICYLDSDLYFFHTPSVIFEELNNKSILITRHNFPENKKGLEVYGKYNVGCQIFKQNATALACLERWRLQCIEWCYDKLEVNRFADQKYLDEWPTLYKDELVVSTNVGINLAPWNVKSCNISVEEECIKANGQTLIFFHFQGLRHLGLGIFSHSLKRYAVNPSTLLINKIYNPYLKHYYKNLKAMRLTKETALRLSKSVSLIKMLKMLIKKEAIRA